MAYRMTAARKAALRKAQAVSARKRRGKGKGKLAKANRSASRNKRIAVVAATGGLALAAAGVAGTYYAKKTASGGPRPMSKKMPAGRPMNPRWNRQTVRSIQRARAHRARVSARINNISRRFTTRQAVNLAGDFIGKQYSNNTFGLPANTPMRKVTRFY
jgi:hypothetical protein